MLLTTAIIFQLKIKLWNLGTSNQKFLWLRFMPGLVEAIPSSSYFIIVNFFKK